MYRVGGTGNASDVNQIVDALAGSNDFGALQLFSQLQPPSALVAAVNSTSGNLTGGYQYKVAFVTGYWQGATGVGTLHTQGNTGGGTVSNTISPSAQQVNLSSIPIGATGVVARILYRTKANGSTFYFLQQINDNTTTTWIDNVADANLGAVMPETNTTGSYFEGDGRGLFNLPVATGTTPGVVKIGAGITITQDGIISVTPYTLPSNVAKIDAAQTWTNTQTFDTSLILENGQTFTNNGTISGGQILGLQSLYTSKVTVDDGNANMSGVAAFNAAAGWPSSPVEGQQAYNETIHRWGYYNGTAWVDPLKYQ